MKYTVVEFVEAFSSALASIRAVFDELGQPWMLVGGLAVGYWTEPRATRDIDFALALPADTSGLFATLTSAGWSVSADELAQASAIGGPVRLRSSDRDKPPIAVDLLCAGTDFERVALARRVATTMLAVSVFVATAEDLIVYKLIASRPQDLADIDRLLRARPDALDLGYVRQWANEWDVEALLDRAIEAASR